MTERPPDKQPSPHLPAPSANRLPGLSFCPAAWACSHIRCVFVGEGGPSPHGGGPSLFTTEREKAFSSSFPQPPPSLSQRAFRAFRLQQPRFPVIPFPHGPSPSKKQQLTHGMMFLKKIIISLYYINYEHRSSPDVRPAAPSAPSAYGRSAFQTTAGRYTNANTSLFRPPRHAAQRPAYFHYFSHDFPILYMLYTKVHHMLRTS